MLFDFGKYTLKFEGEDKYINSLNGSWQRYRSKKACGYDAAISLCKKSMPSCSEASPHWCTDTDASSSEAIFYDRKKALFSLTSVKNDRDVRVYINSDLPGNTTVGIQYGMMLSLASECVGIHGVTVICEGKTIILSAPSGTGKSTLASLLHKHFGAAIVNGDFALLSIEDGGIIFEPTPFCGTSGICHNVRLKIDRIVFLEQALQNEWHNISIKEALVRIMSNIFLPEWDAAASGAIQNNVMKIIEAVPVSKFSFAPNGDAAEMFTKKII